MMVARIKANLDSIINEVFGDKTDHPLIARFFASAVDFFLLGVAGLPLYYFLDANEVSGLLRLAIVLPLWQLYFTLGNSRLFKGQTIGKKLMRIRVADAESKYLGIGKAFIRSIPVVLIMNFLPIMSYVIEEGNGRLNTTVYFTLLTLGFATLYFVLLQTSRQGIHDLLASSQVIPAKRDVLLNGKFNPLLMVYFVLGSIVALVYLYFGT